MSVGSLAQLEGRSMFSVEDRVPPTGHPIAVHTATTLAFIATSLVVTLIGLAADLVELTVLGLLLAFILTGTLLVIRAGYPYLASAVARVLIVLVTQIGVLAAEQIDVAPLLFAIVVIHAAATATMFATLLLSGFVLSMMGSWYWLLDGVRANRAEPGLILLDIALVVLVVAGALVGIRLRERGENLLGQSQDQAHELSASLSAAHDELARVNAELEARVVERTQDLERSLSKHQALVRELGELAQRDALTGLWNRRALDHALWRPELQACSHCLLIADLDHFKVVNDTFGHLAGDAALRAVAGAFTANLRDGDTISRIGGEEFAVLLPDTRLGTAQLVAERLRRAVQWLRIPELAEYQLTMSIGLAICGGCACTEHPAGSDHRAMLVAAADLALYEAKALGRNRVVLPATEAARQLDLRAGAEGPG